MGTSFLSSQFASRGSLFTSDFLTETVRRIGDWTDLNGTQIDNLETQLKKAFADFRTDDSRNESQTPPCQ